MHSFDRSQLETGPCPAAPGGELIVTMTPPRDDLREQLRVILYYRLGDRLWVVTHDDVRLSKFMQATCEQEVLGANLRRSRQIWLPVLAVVACLLACLALAVLVLSCPVRGWR